MKQCKDGENVEVRAFGERHENDKKDSKESLDKFFEGMTLFLWMIIILLMIVFVGQRLELWRL